MPTVEVSRSWYRVATVISSQEIFVIEIEQLLKGPLSYPTTPLPPSKCYVDTLESLSSQMN